MRAIVNGLLIFLLLYTVAVLVVFVLTDGQEPAVLTGSVFAAATGEFGLLAWLKRHKSKDDRGE